MQRPIDRVMQTYGLLVKLTAEQEKVARENVMRHLESVHLKDENKLAVEGLRYLRASSPIAGSVDCERPHAAARSHHSER